MKIFGIQILYPLSKRQWRSALLLFVAYVAATQLSSATFAAPGLIFPAAGIALAALFLEGFALWPVVFFASLAGYVLSGASPVYMLILPVAHTLQAVCGAYLLRKLNLDPLFRRMKDMFALLGVTLIVAAIVPTLGTLARHLNAAVYGTPLSSVTWGSWYAAILFSLLIITPFIIRWFGKPRFTRSLYGTLEILTAFVIFCAISYFLFFTETTSIAGVSLGFLLLAPLFWIALRLRPRFTTLAFVLLSLFAFGNIFFGITPLLGETLGVRLFQTELFISILAVIFFTLTSLEEERRMTANLMRSQVSTLETALTQVAGQDRAKSEFIAMLAHELRNPLAPVASSIDLLRLKDPQGSERIEILDLMENRMHTVKRLLDDLLDVSRITENKLVLEKEQVEVSVIVERAVASAEQYFKERTQTVVVHLPEEALIIEADPVRIEQVVTNLLTNASKFSNPRDEIRLDARASGSMVEITVSDQGVGIDKEMAGRIFEPFLQIELGKRTRQGLGIGLALVRNLTEMHGGSVRARSEGAGRGSQFTVLLPLVKRLNGQKTRSKKDAHASWPADTGKRILVVDDNDVAAWGIGKLLELKGYRIDYAYDGEQALEKALGDSPDAVFLDIGLPDMDGYTAGNLMRKKGYKGLIVALTGYSLEEDRGKAAEAGFDGHLVKPAGLADLIRALEPLREESASSNLPNVPGIY